MKPDSDLNIRLSNYKNECGCALAAKFMAGAFALGLVFSACRYGIISIGFLTHLPLVLLAAFLATGLGKATGILYAKFRYKRLCAQLAESRPA